MANVRQMPQMYLRGSLANITMRNLTRGQQAEAAALLDRIANHTEMQRHKIKVMRELGVTIAADYADDRAAAEAEYRIAIWRGIIELFFHHKYSFRCEACHSSTYITKRSKPKLIDRIQTPCPNCKRLVVKDPGDVATLIAGQVLTEDDFQSAYADLPDGYRAPVSRSTIVPIAGERKYDNPQAIIDDDRQLRKFFGEFVWNYFRQQINENKRKEHQKGPRPITGPTDWVITQEIISLCTQMEVDFNYCEKIEPSDGRYTIRLFGLLTSPEFTVAFSLLRLKAAMYGVPVVVTPATVEVLLSPDAAPLPLLTRKRKQKTQTYQALVFKPEHVSVLDNLASIADETDKSDFTLSQVSHRTVGGLRMDLEDHVAVVEADDAMNTVRDALPEGDCRIVFDILSQQGDTYNLFSDLHGNGEARVNHIATFLGITPRTVNNYKRNIYMQCLAHNLTPANQ